MDAALKVFADRGIQKAVMADIARESELSRSLIYFYFKDKRALHIALERQALTLLAEYFESAVSRHQTGLDQITAIGHAYVRFAHQRAEQFWILCNPASTGLEDSENDENGRRVIEIMCEALSRGVADGSIRADLGDPLATALTLWGSVHGLIQFAHTKAGIIEHRFQFDSSRLTRNGIELLTRSMENPDRAG